MLRTLRDAQEIVERAGKARHAVVVGGGILGIEAAQGLHARGVRVTLVHRGPWLLEKMLDRVGGELVRTRMRRDGVEVRIRDEVASVDGTAKGPRSVALQSGRSARCDLLVLAIGIVPNTEWLEGAGIQLVSGYVPVDRRMRVQGVTDVFAAGDLAHFEDASLPYTNAGGLWQPAVKQGLIAGFNMADPRGDDQYRPGAIYNATRAWDLDVVTLGDHVDGDGKTITWRPRGSSSPVLKKALLRDGRLRGVALLGDRREGRPLQRLMNLRGEAANVSSIADRLFDPAFDLFSWVAAQERAPNVRRYNHDVAAPIGPLPRAKSSERTILRHDLALPAEGETALLTSAAPGPIRFSLDGSAHVFEGPTVRIGTMPSADLRLPGTAGTQVDVLVQLEGMVWMLQRPEHRRMWVVLNGRPVTRRVPLQRGDVLQAGPHRLVIDFDGRGSAAPPPVSEVSAWLFDGAQRHRLTKRCTLIGAGSDCDVIVSAPGVSRSHAQIIRQGRPPAFYVVDAGSLNGTNVNGEPVRATRRLRPGDRIELTDQVLEYAETDEAPRQAADAPTQMAVSAPAGYLVARTGRMRGQSVPLPRRGSLGRGVAADVRLDDPLLSRVHARFKIGDDGLRLEDMGSENGTVVRDERIAPGKATQVDIGDRIRLGRGEFEFRLEPADEGKLFEALDAPSSADDKTVQLESYRYRLEEIQRGEPAQHPLLGDAITIGRASSNDIALAKKDVSREHCRLERGDEGFELLDLGSRYGTHVNDRPLEGDARHPLRDGDEIRLGRRATFVFRKERDRGERIPDHVGEVAIATLAPLRPSMAAKMPPASFTGSGPWVIGRQESRCAIPVPFETVSRTHCAVHREDKHFFVENLSTLGTFVNREDVPEGESLPLRDGDVLTLQDIDFRFREEAVGRAAPGAIAWAEGFAGEPTFAENPLDEDLHATVRQELDACIGCHECMRACPLPQADDVTIAALNAHAGGLGEPTEIVDRFVHACTQCHACVPVCPVDIRRSRLVLWNKLKRVPRPEERVTLQVGREQVDGSLTLGDVAKNLRKHEVFEVLERPALLDLLGASRFRQLESGETLIEEGEYPDALWVVLSGQLEVGMAAMKRRFLPMTTLGPGQTVAEVALLASQPMDQTARATERSLVVGLTQYALTSARSLDAAFSERVESLYVNSATAQTLRRLRISGEAKAALRRELLPERYDIGRVIMSRVESNDTVGIVHRGFVREVRRTGTVQRVANYLKPGDVFGGLETLETADVLLRYEAATRVEVFTLHRERIDALERDHRGIRDALLPSAQPKARKRDKSEQDLGQAGVAGMLQATQLLVIDTRLCVDCDNCVSACERRHGSPRLERQNSGLQQGPFQVPASCYHCVDPLCLFCAVDGIVRETSGEIRIVEDNCIGCGACAERCPYDNIFMRPRELPRRSLLERLVPKPLHGVFRIDRRGRAHMDLEEVAIKCDLCADHHNGPACVRSCPVGAAVRADPADLFGVGRGRRA